MPNHLLVQPPSPSPLARNLPELPGTLLPSTCASAPPPARALAARWSLSAEQGPGARARGIPYGALWPRGPALVSWKWGSYFYLVFNYRVRIPRRRSEMVRSGEL